MNPKYLKDIRFLHILPWSAEEIQICEILFKNFNPVPVKYQVNFLKIRVDLFYFRIICVDKSIIPDLVPQKCIHR